MGNRKFILFSICGYIVFCCFAIANAQYTNINNLQNQTNSNDSVAIDNSTFYFTIRYGQGGFSDRRSPIGKLGGGQLTLDIRYRKYPIALSISGEFYTNSAEPTHNYEIAGMTVINLLYMPYHVKEKRLSYFTGGGIGQLEVPKYEDNPDKLEKGWLFDIEAGINYRIFWKIGLYGIGKYLYAQKKVNGVKIINFDELIVLLGLTFNFGI